jgi:hypothetical protein
MGARWYALGIGAVLRRFTRSIGLDHADPVSIQVFLASHDSNLMTGSIININSGQWVG